MALSYVVVAITIFLTISCSVCEPGDPVMYLPPMELRTMDSENRFNIPSGIQFQPLHQHMAPSQQIFHTSSKSLQTPIDTTSSEKPADGKHNFTFNEFVEALNQIENKEEKHESRAAARDYDYPQYNPYPGGYGYQRPYGGYGYPRPYGPTYGPWTPPSYHQPGAAYVPPKTVHHSTKKEETGILKPVATKVASKVSGLIGLVLTLLTGSAPDDLELKGFKDVVINGIVKPLLVAKGGIKSLISKLTIPVISLLLINLEVLITIWWLWEDCPEPDHHPQPPPAYSYPKPGYNYNSYR